MKILLGILVLGLLLSGGATTNSDVVDSEVKMWQNYLNLKEPYKAYAKILNWKGRYKFDKMFKSDWSSVDNAIAWIYQHEICSQGCIITHIGNNEISLEEQKEIAKKWLPKHMVTEYFKKPKKIAKKPKKKKLESDDNKVIPASMGSGFFVTRAGHIVTNYHVIEGCDSVKTNTLGKEIRADVVAIDKTNDLAILKTKMNPTKVFPVSNKDVSLLQDVIVAGFPLGNQVSSSIKIHKGNVTALAGFGDNYSNFQTDATINQGNSGGPIMNQMGNIVGVAVQLIAAEHAQNVFFGVKSSTLRTFAQANNIKFLTPNYRDMSNEDLGEFITEATVFLECWMTVAKIKQISAQEENRKAFYREHQ
jgi:S1-C subfamily serine protease